MLIGGASCKPSSVRSPPCPGLSPMAHPLPRQNAKTPPNTCFMVPSTTSLSTPSTSGCAGRTLWPTKTHSTITNSSCFPRPLGRSGVPERPFRMTYNRPNANGCVAITHAVTEYMITHNAIMLVIALHISLSDHRLVATTLRAICQACPNDLPGEIRTISRWTELEELHRRYMAGESMSTPIDHPTPIQRKELRLPPDILNRPNVTNRTC